MEILTQIIGFAAVVMFVISYQIKSNKKLYFFQLIGLVLFGIQFMLLKAWSGCISLLLIIPRDIFLMKHNEWSWVRSKWFAIVYTILFTIVLVWTWNGPISLLAYAASVVSTLGYWRNNAKMIRLSNLCCASPCWMIYDVIVHSWGGALNELITVISIVVSIVRFGWNNLDSEEFLK